MITRIAGENKGWGYRRIKGELKKLGIRIGDSTVRKIMIEEGVEPPPYLRQEEPPITWKNFIEAHMESLVACDFFTREIHSIFGSYRVYVLVFIHLGSRKVYHSFPTEHPTNDWIMQQCRNASMWLGDEGLKISYLIRDRDALYPEKHMKVFWESEDVKVIKTPVQSPKANAFVESYIGKCKRECLNHMTCFHPTQLNYISQQWCKHYNSERPHRGRGIDNNVLDVDFTAALEGKVKCKQRLGGLLKSYYREAAQPASTFQRFVSFNYQRAVDIGELRPPVQIHGLRSETLSEFWFTMPFPVVNFIRSWYLRHMISSIS